MTCKRHCILSIFIALLIGVALACRRTPTPLSSTPTAPAHLLSLPVWARIECPERESWRTGVTLWEHAERPPSEWGSPMGDMGTDVGVVENCEAVEVLDYEWSFFGEEFWVLIDNHNGQRGWLAIHYVEFAP